MPMSTPAPKSQPKTIADWLALPDDSRFELIDGELVEKAAPTFEHGTAQTLVAGTLAGSFHHRSGGPRGPGGWWIVTEVDVVLDGRGYLPDVAGWRRERVPAALKERPVTIRPDWICEIVSESNRTVDTVTKLRRYQQAGVPHYWIIDQVDRTLTVHRHTPEGYLVALRAAEQEMVRAEPFEAIEIEVRVLLGGDPA
jgi:Uma2 family endonuclease